MAMSKTAIKKSRHKAWKRQRRRERSDGQREDQQVLFVSHHEVELFVDGELRMLRVVGAPAKAKECKTLVNRIALGVHIKVPLDRFKTITDCPWWQSAVREFCERTRAIAVCQIRGENDLLYSEDSLLIFFDDDETAMLALLKYT
jgi:hypothetical protein